MINLPAEPDEEPVEVVVTESEPTLTEPEAEKPADEVAPEPVPEGEVTDDGVMAADVEASTEVKTEVKIEDVEPSPQPKKRRRLPTGKRGKKQPTLRQVTARFAGCVRCSYFWTGYRVIHGVEELETAVSHAKSGWLELEWDRQMPELIYKSYAIRMDISHFHYEGCCQECRRHFVYKTAVNEDCMDDFRIEISPRIVE
ncbi:MAG: hypothetical protein GY805_03715 [Chloroflexi bacterium]|nr:hypothetical protein [Chloroflexota bacterium]